MRAILLGKPGSGKGTQARRAAARSGIVVVSSGDLIRQAIAECTDLGRLFDHYAQQGLLVPDDLILAVIEERLGQPDCAEGFLLDGFPRTLVQAQTLEGWLDQRSRPLQGALYLEVPDEVLIERAVGRRFCPRDGVSYHLTFAPPKRAGHCDVCEGALEQRDDDVLTTVAARLQEYQRKTAPLIAFYAARALLRTIDGVGPMQEVEARIIDALGTPSSAPP